MEAHKPFLSIIIPAYNEARRLPATLDAIREYLLGKNFAYEVIVVDDGSWDETSELAERHPLRPRVIKNTRNRGKGAVVKEGVMNSLGHYILFIDADNATPIQQVERLLAHSQRFPVVIGSRHIPGANIKIAQPKHRVLLSRFSNLLIRVVACPGIYDTQCGFKLFEANAGRNIFASVTLDRFGFDFEAIMIAMKLGYPIKEQGVDWYDHPGSKVRAGRDAVKTFIDLIKIKLRDIFGGYRKVSYIHGVPKLKTHPKETLSRVSQELKNS